MIEEYPGDEAWHSFVDAWSGQTSGSVHGIEDTEIATVIRAILEDQADAWIYEHVPALDGRSVHEVLEELGPRPIRALLMRLPV